MAVVGRYRARIERSALVRFELVPSFRQHSRIMPPRQRMKVVIIPDSDSGSEEPEVVMISDSDSGSVEPEISFARPASHPVRPIPPLLPRPPPALALASVSQSNYVPFGEHMNVVRDVSTMLSLLLWCPRSILASLELELELELTSCSSLFSLPLAPR